MADRSPEEQLAGFLAKYTPEIAARAEAVLARMRARLPGAVGLVYDNYNALVIGFCPTARPSSVLFSIVLYPRYVSLCFFAGDALSDPEKLLQGGGKIARHIRLEGPETLDRPAVQALMTQALELAPTPLDPAQPCRLVIQSISAKQRPRRPAGA